MSAPNAAVAVQPYQYIAGRKLPIDGPTVSREWCVPRSTTPIVGIDGEQREIQLERDHIEDRECGPVCKCESAKPWATTS